MEDYERKEGLTDAFDIVNDATKVHGIDQDQLLNKNITLSNGDMHLEEFCIKENINTTSVALLLDPLTEEAKKQHEWAKDVINKKYGGDRYHPMLPEIVKERLLPEDTQGNVKWNPSVLVQVSLTKAITARLGFNRARQGIIQAIADFIRNMAGQSSTGDKTEKAKGILSVFGFGKKPEETK